MIWRIKLILLGYPNGLMGQIIRAEHGEVKYTLWDRIRYRLITGEGLK